MCELDCWVYVIEFGHHGVKLLIDFFPYDEHVVDEFLPDVGFDRFVFEEKFFEFRHKEIG